MSSHLQQVRSTTRGHSRSRAWIAALLAVGCALIAASMPAAALAVPSETPFEVLPGSFRVTPAGTGAGAHEDLVTSFDFAHNGTGQTFNDVSNVIVSLPAGFDGNNTAVPTCTQAQLIGHSITEGSECPPASQVGTIKLDLTFEAKYGPVMSTFPVYNMEVTSYGEVAELGFRTIAFSATLLVNVRPGDSGLTISSLNIQKRAEPHNITVTIWGLPASKVHDPERGQECYTLGAPSTLQCVGGGESANIAVKPFLSNPTSCGTFTASMRADSWEKPESWSEATDSGIGPIEGCDRVPFAPLIEAQPTTRSAESPTGLNLSMVVPQHWEEPFSISTSDLQDVKLTLPEGVTVNPSAGSGLGACTPEQYEAETSSSLPGEGCPPESKIGSIEIETPVLAEKIPGAVYVAKPYDNPFDSLLGLYIVAKDPQRGILVKLAGKIEPNAVTGQLVTTFDDNPQQPFSKFTLKFRPGATAPLVSPPVCGTNTTQAELTPWSAPDEALLVASSFETTSGVHEGPCPNGGLPPFKPQVVSGTENNDGGGYSPFYLRILREDGEQEITKFSTTLPPGLTGNLTGIPFCSDAAIQAAREVSGAQEEAEASCPAASEIGHTIVEAGVGTVLAQTPGKVYLAGPYNGAPLSIVSITSAKVGPFDLGTVVIRFALDINPTTAQVEVSGAGSDPIPHIIDGIVVHVRDIRVYMDRHDFTVNPTNCSPLGITDAITGAGADPANPADQDTVNVNTPFEAANCASLRFAPVFKVFTAGRTSRSAGASLGVKLTMPGAQNSNSNIKAVKVDLPRQLPSRLSTLQKACTDAQFETDPAGCPAASIVGHAKALTPVLPVPLEGPAYFVSHGGAKFPELIVVLQGYGFTIDLHGETFISKEGITSSTFRAIPDQPVTSFELTLPEGTDSALAANGDLCTSTLTMPTAFVAQNGAEVRQSTPIEVTGCKPAIKIVSHRVKGASVTIVANVPSAGKLTLSGKGLSTAVKSAAKAGDVTATLTLTRAEQALLKGHPGRKLTATVALRFKPKRGAILTSRVTALVG
jgi:hypothetical protein